MERRSVVAYLENFLRRGRECAYVQRRGYRAVRWNYGRVAGVAFQFARELHKRGIGKGERVLLWGPNSAEWVAAFFGCALRGAVVVPIDDAGPPTSCGGSISWWRAGSCFALASMPSLSNQLPHRS